MGTQIRQKTLSFGLGRILAILVYSLLLSGPLLAQLSITATTDATTLTNAIEGYGVTISGLTTNEGSTTSQIGTFTGGTTPTGPGPTVGIENGMLLVGGDVASASGPNNLAGSSTGSGTDTLTDADLGTLTGRTGNCAAGDQCDVVIVEFDVVSIGRNIEVDFVFGAEEYPEYVCSQFNDAVGIFFSGPGISGPYSNGGINLADLPGASVVAVNNINGGLVGNNQDGTPCTLTNTAGYVYNTVADNTGAPDPTNFTNTQFDGLTIPMTAKVTVTPGATYRIRIALADIGDSSWDTGMFIGEIRGGGIDYGDAPDSYNTAVANPNGVTLVGAARHSIINGLSIGSLVDGDNNGLPGANADGDDTDGDNPTDGDDEDGVANFPVGFTGNTYSVTVNVTNTTGGNAFLVGYIDFNGDGDFLDAGEQSASTTIPTGSNNAPFVVTFTVDPTTATTNATYARFRLSSDLPSIQSHLGPAPDGEVEDYPIPAGFLPVVLTAFQTSPHSGGMQFSWSTVTETFNTGFYLYEEVDGKRQRIHEKLIPSRSENALSPNHYQWESRVSRSGPFWLSEVSYSGHEAFYGPFAIGKSYGRSPNPTPIPWAQIEGEQHHLMASWHRNRPQSTEEKPVTSMGIRVSQAGFQKLTFERLRDAGLDIEGIPNHTLALTHKGLPVPRQILSSDDRFGPGDSIVFIGETKPNDLYDESQRYVLSLNRRLAKPAIEPSFAIHGKQATHYLETMRFEEENHYSFSAPNGDPWFAQPMLSYGGPFTTAFPFTLDQWFQQGQDPILRLSYWGVTNWPGDSPDHHLVANINGFELAGDSFDGLQARLIEIPLNKTWLNSDENILEIVVPGDTGFDFDLIHLDYFEIVYPRRFAADSQGNLKFSSSDHSFTIQAVPSAQTVVWAQTTNQSYALPFEYIEKKGAQQLVFQGISGSEDIKTPVYHIGHLPSMTEPALMEAPQFHPNLLTGQADLLIISHPSFVLHLDRFIQAKENAGIRTKTVSVTDIYDHFNFGNIHPQAIHTYIQAAAQRLGIEAVLLVGGDTYDYKNHLGTGSISFIPSLYAQTHDLISFAPVDPLFGDLDRDKVPDIPIGRFPVRQLEELQWLIQKSIQTPVNPSHVVFAADDSPHAFFKATSEQLTALLPPAWTSQGIYLDDQPVDQAHPTLFQALNQSPTMVNFMGHSAPTAWTFDGLFDDDDASDLTNQNPFFVLQWGCWNTYHVEPSYDTMGHRFLLSGQQGASAVIGAATLTTEATDQALGIRLFPKLFQPGTTIGQAMIDAKKDLASTQPGAVDVILGWTLLGDPTLFLINP